ncbi:two-component sensor histidine kinase [Bordetella ansorpii]|uniref:Two-component sensor histidine kinase n=1 Tax=Bordetella ansorpii TaxID=288768 RepID=A0A157R153_9BORD|nr:ATP-binding protein [Bordetella ansorpii]SAI50949.1 two-component sensor histidine kinase [Bordetella ansorpii]
MIQRWFGALLAVLAAVIASAPLWLTLPEPSAALRIGHATFSKEDEPPRQIGLPHAQDRPRAQGRYRMAFELADAPAQPLYLFIPMLSYRAVIALDGDTVQDTGTDSLIPGITLGVSALVPLSGRHLAAGRHEIDILLEAPGITPGYLSALYVGTAQQVAPYYRMRIFLFEHTRMMVLACQLLLAIATLMAWLYRPQESLYGWLFLLHGVSTVSYVGLLRDVIPDVFDWLPYALMVNMSSMFILHVIALKINGTKPPLWLCASVAAVPGAGLLVMASGAAPASAMAVGVAAIMVTSPLITAAISAWGALVKKVREAWLLLLPLCFFSLATLHDGAIIAGALDGPILLSLYYRQLLIVAIAVILMRRLGRSLMRVDGANALLKRRLAEREAELRRLHDQERNEAVCRVRSKERHRLTMDLHDGLSGHLASIIAQAERGRSADIERTAREALDDLRLVIHSMDIGDRELVAALSGLRERLEPQLKRLGVALEWSMMRLPDIAGVTPTHALHVMRIVQEAVTNAVRHGPASCISVRGDAGQQGAARIVIENDGIPSAGTGQGGAGVRNMDRRAAILGGAVSIEARTTGTRVTLTLPRRLSDAPTDAGLAVD